MDAASQRQPLSAIVSARTNAHAAIGNRRYAAATTAVTATTPIPAKRALRIERPSRSLHQLISLYFYVRFGYWVQGSEFWVLGFWVLNAEP